mmetsp:Transcript_50809/g.99341  ORF Transcript_50809/g.99341 Transcript_50809/m.99341 type:complete len:259 (-) Transcript_50809:3485-4261(-)
MNVENCGVEGPVEIDFRYIFCPDSVATLATVLNGVALALLPPHEERGIFLQLLPLAEPPGGLRTEFDGFPVRPRPDAVGLRKLLEISAGRRPPVFQLRFAHGERPPALVGQRQHALTLSPRLHAVHASQYGADVVGILLEPPLVELEGVAPRPEFGQPGLFHLDPRPAVVAASPGAGARPLLRVVEGVRRMGVVAVETGAVLLFPEPVLGRLQHAKRGFRQIQFFVDADEVFNARPRARVVLLFLVVQGLRVRSALDG